MVEPDIKSLVASFADVLPKFPDGRINYRDAKTAPVLSAVVRRQQEILLLKRSDQVRYYQGRWNVVAGYIDAMTTLQDKVLAELHEELGVTNELIHVVDYGMPRTVIDKEVGVQWIIFPVLVELLVKPVLQLNEEHTEYRWVLPEEVKNFSTVPLLGDTLAAFL
ncbi:MAG: NUDIX domain-containing protein [Patescibacteria group bacterium]|jgi:8-oxo-dGTP pyrophosphatase MutT (NUDIX family)